MPYKPSSAVRPGLPGHHANIVEQHYLAQRRMDALRAELENGLDADITVAHALTTLRDYRGLLEYLDDDQIRAFMRTAENLDGAISKRIDKLRDTGHLCREFYLDLLPALRRARKA